VLQFVEKHKGHFVIVDLEQADAALLLDGDYRLAHFLDALHGPVELNGVVLHLEWQVEHFQVQVH
jgi:hypothetical protein